jgi:transcriptional regulator with XRE-family HTH domain
MAFVAKEKIGDRIIRLRQEMGLNQLELAIKAGLKQATVSRIELNDVKQPGPDVLGKLATALNTTVDYLIGRTNFSIPLHNFVPGDPTIEFFLKVYSKMDRFDVPNLIRSIWQHDSDGTRDQLKKEILKSQMVLKVEPKNRIHEFISLDPRTGRMTKKSVYRGKVVKESTDKGYDEK